MYSLQNALSQSIPYIVTHQFQSSPFEAIRLVLSITKGFYSTKWRNNKMFGYDGASHVINVPIGKCFQSWAPQLSWFFTRSVYCWRVRYILFRNNPVTNGCFPAGSMDYTLEDTKLAIRDNVRFGRLRTVYLRTNPIRIQMVKDVFVST